MRGKLRLGWAGNRQESTKGFEEFVRPLEALPGVELVFCGYADQNLTVEEMPGFYESIDALICTSLSEGNNNCLLEAAAMERAIVTTDTGTVPEYLEDGESALIVERKSESFLAAVERLRDDPDLRVSLGRRARSSVLADWDWEKKAEEHRIFFRQALECRDSHVTSPTKWMEPTWGELEPARKVVFLQEQLEFDEHRLRRSDAELQAVILDRERLRREIDALRQHLEDGRDGLEDEANRAQSWKVERDRLMNELEALKNSRTWRWSRPLAAVLEWVLSIVARFRVRLGANRYRTR